MYDTKYKMMHLKNELKDMAGVLTVATFRLGPPEDKTEFTI